MTLRPSITNSPAGTSLASPPTLAAYSSGVGPAIAKPTIHGRHPTSNAAQRAKVHLPVLCRRRSKAIPPLKFLVIITFARPCAVCNGKFGVGREALDKCDLGACWG